MIIACCDVESIKYAYEVAKPANIQGGPKTAHLHLLDVKLI